MKKPERYGEGPPGRGQRRSTGGPSTRRSRGFALVGFCKSNEQPVLSGTGAPMGGVDTLDQIFWAAFGCCVHPDLYGSRGEGEYTIPNTRSVVKPPG
jgi:hypothetical protein